MKTQNLISPTVAKMEAAALHFSRILHCDHVIITSTFALHRYGICKEPHDLDIIVINPSVDALDILLNFASAPESKHLLITHKEEYADIPEHLYRIMYDGFKVDFFIVENETRDFIELANGLKLSTVPVILAAKRRAGRLKDFLQMRSMSEVFFKQAELDAFLIKESNKLWKQKEQPLLTES